VRLFSDFTRLPGRTHARLRATWSSFIEILGLALFGAIWALNDQTDERHWATRRARRRLDGPSKDATVTQGPRAAPPS
jgi:hypothetical protein